MTFMNSKLSYKIILWTFVLLGWSQLNGQTNSTRWKDHFSYNNIKHIWEINNMIFCSAENGLFSYDLSSGEIQTISKVNELNDVGINAFNYNPANHIIFIGYQSGEMDLLTPDNNVNLLEIPLHQAYTGSKIVNHISSEENTAVISGEFGLASFSLENFEFMETCYFVQAGSYFGVNETAILNGMVYAASDRGIFIHPLDEFLANFVTWQQPAGIPTTNFEHIVKFQGNIVASSGNNVYRFDGNNWSFWTTFPDLRDLSINGNVLSVTQINRVSNYNPDFGLIDAASYQHELNTGIRIGTNTYAGSKLHGLLYGTTEILPDGPYNNKSWSISCINDNIWIAPGGMNNYNNPQLNADGYYHFDGTKWNHIKSENLLDAKDIVHIEVNPNNISEVYVSSWFEHVAWSNPGTHIGFFRVVNDVMTDHYNDSNTPLKHRLRVPGTTLDEQGNLWVTQSFIDQAGPTAIGKKSPSGSWTYLDLGGVPSKAGVRPPVIYQDHAWVALPRSGGVKVTDMQNVYQITNSPTLGDLPSDYVISLAFDKNDVLWIGTALGLRILYNPLETVKSGNFETYPIIIEQNGIPEALLTDVQINDIEVDGANRKWVATESAGVYYFSESGEETIYNFTTSNSPLPSNIITDIEVDPKTGTVYFATDKGVVSFRSDAVDVGDSFGDVYAYPNPVRPGFNGVVTIKGLPNDADVRITDIVGNLIYKTKGAGGTAQWDTKNMHGKPVASGIYLVLMSTKDGQQTKQTKIAVVR